MRRHWQHTSFCMGQCVSSCGSKRTLDSVPTTPDTENYPPGLISSSLGTVTSSKCSSINYQFDNLPYHHHPALALSSAGLGRSRSQSPAAKFVSTFSKKKIVARRINPGGESPVHITKHPSPAHLPLHTTTLLTPYVVSASQDGDMKGAPVKNYFRETISSAKKTAASKSVTFSAEVVPPPPLSTSSRKKHFFSFSTTLTTKSGNKKESSQEQSSSGRGDAPSPAPTRKGFLRRKSKSRSPTPGSVTRSPPKVCRITLSPKQGSSKGGELQSSSSSSFNSLRRESKSNGVETVGSNENDQNQGETRNNQQTMGNATSAGSNAVEVLKASKSVIVKSNSAVGIKGGKRGDINENTTPTTQHLHSHSHTLPASKSVESPELIRRNEIPTKSSTLDSNVLRNLNSIKEENRLLRLKFFASDSASSLGQENSFAEDATDMNRQAEGRSGIPQSKLTGAKSQNNASGIPKLYSISTGAIPEQGNKSRLKPPSSKVITSQQPTNLNNGKWVPAANFFEPPNTSASDTPERPHTSPPAPEATTTRGNRRSSEPPRWPPGGNRLLRDHKVPADSNVERRGTIGFQPKKLPTATFAGIPRAVKVSTTSTSSSTTNKATSVVKVVASTQKVGVRKPEETKPFYTIGLYQNRPKTAGAEPSRQFGVLRSGFQGVSTGIVRQRAQQYQSKGVEEGSNVLKASTSTVAIPENKETPTVPIQQDSPKKSPGVIRSATYTIRKHGAMEASPPPTSATKSKSDVDPRYRTWTVRKGAAKKQPGELSRTLHIVNDEIGELHSHMHESIMSEASGISIGYPLQHNASTMSTSSMGTNEDGIGDHVVISDSEYLIDDEISDQPELTLTFKESSLKLSPSTSGESLLSSDIMLDHLDHNTERILGELTSDSAISDISTHNKPTSHSSSNLSKLSNVKATSSASSLLEQSPKILELRSKASLSDIPSPAFGRTVRHPKSPRRVPKNSSSTTSTPISKALRQPQSGDTSIPRLTSSSSNSNLSYKTPVKSQKQRTAAHEMTKNNVSGKPSHVRSILASPPSLSPVNQIKSTIAKKDPQVVGLTIENVSKLHKQYELEDSAAVASSEPDNEAVSSNVNNDPFPEVPYQDELLGGIQDLKHELETLQVQLETQERREKEKDELILRLTGEVDRLKSLVGKDNHRNGNIIEELDKERYINNSLNYENAAVQTENNNIFNRAVTYPEEEDKYGELVSFRIGRSSSVKKKL